MSELRGTPGPFYVRLSENYPFDIETVDSSGNVICSERLHAHSTCQKTPEDALNAVGFKGTDKEIVVEILQKQLADAKARAAWWDLLEALQLLLQDASAVDHGIELEPAILQANKAIAKALGQ